MIRLPYRDIHARAKKSAGIVLWDSLEKKRVYYTCDFDLAKSFERHYSGDFEYYGYGYLVTI